MPPRRSFLRAAMPPLALALLQAVLPARAAAADAANAAFAAVRLSPAAACAAPGRPVDDKGFVSVGGIEQWVRIKGDSCANPVVVLVHGGPGNPTTPFADHYYRSWEKDFTIVQWDQRGAGMTYRRNPVTDDVPLRVEQLRDDGIAVARLAAQRFGRRRVILVGGSWSSVLGVHMAKAAPELFCGVVVNAQVTGPLPTRDSVDAVLARARVAGDGEAVARIEALGPLPWTDPRAPGIFRRVIRKYEGLRTEPVPAAWKGTPPEYATPAYAAAYEAGEDYSWLQFVGMKGDGIAARIDLAALGPTFKVPVLMLQGEEDLLTMPGPSRRYFDAIEAPRKAFVTVPRAGHDPNPPMVAAQLAQLETLKDCR